MKIRCFIWGGALLAVACCQAGIDFKSADTNRDGLLTPEEYVSYQEATKGTGQNYNNWFRKRDADQNGVLTKEELERKAKPNPGKAAKEKKREKQEPLKLVG